MSTSNAFPEYATIDLHDLAAIFMYERMRHESKFSHFRLRIYEDGPIFSVNLRNPGSVEAWDDPPHQARPKRSFGLIRDDMRRDGDIVMKDGTNGVTPGSFLENEKIRLPPGIPSPLSYQSRELIYWRCKNHDSGFALVYAMQTVLDALPRTTTLLARMKKERQNVRIAPGNFRIMQFRIKAHELTTILRMTPDPTLPIALMNTVTSLTGMDGGIMPWVYIVLGDATTPEVDKQSCAALDLACTMLGARGPAGEIFALARGKEYLQRTLAPVADDLGEVKGSSRLRYTGDDQEELHFLAGAVLERIRRVVIDDEPFCAHCGSPDSAMRCSKCKEVSYCSREHQLAGWAFHKVYCQPAAGK